MCFHTGSSMQEKLLNSLRRVLRSHLTHLGWPPPLARPSSPAPGQPQLVEASSSWQGFEAATQEVHSLAVLAWKLSSPICQSWMMSADGTRRFQ